MGLTTEVMARRTKSTSRRAPSLRAWAVVVELRGGRVLFHSDDPGDRPWAPRESQARRFPTEMLALRYAEQCAADAVGGTVYRVIELPAARR